MKCYRWPAFGLVFAASLFSVSNASGSSPPLLSASILFHSVSYNDAHASGQLSLQVCNTGQDEVRNVNVRAASAFDRLSQGVVQFGAISGGTCASLNADFVLDTRQLDETGGVAVRIQYDLAGSPQEFLNQATVIDSNS